MCFSAVCLKVILDTLSGLDVWWRAKNPFHVVHSCNECAVMVYLMEFDVHVKCFTSSERLRECPSGPVIPNPRILFCSCKQKKVIEVYIDFTEKKNIFVSLFCIFITIKHILFQMIITVIQTLYLFPLFCIPHSFLKVIYYYWTFF